MLYEAVVFRLLPVASRLYKQAECSERQKRESHIHQIWHADLDQTDDREIEHPRPGDHPRKRPAKALQQLEEERCGMAVRQPRGRLKIFEGVRDLGDKAEGTSEKNSTCVEPLQLIQEVMR